MATILVVDPDVHIRNVLSGLLLADGHDVIGLDDGEAALRQLATGLRPHLVVTEMDLAGITGSDLVRAVWTRPGLERSPVIVISALQSAIAVRDLLGHDAVGFLAKPFDILALRRVLSDLLRSRSQETQARFARPGFARSG